MASADGADSRAAGALHILLEMLLGFGDGNNFVPRSGSSDAPCNWPVQRRFTTLTCTRALRSALTTLPMFVEIWLRFEEKSMRYNEKPLRHEVLFLQELPPLMELHPHKKPHEQLLLHEPREKLSYQKPHKALSLS